MAWPSTLGVFQSRDSSSRLVLTLEFGAAAAGKARPGGAAGGEVSAAAPPLLRPRRRRLRRARRHPHPQRPHAVQTTPSVMPRTCASDADSTRDSQAGAGRAGRAGAG
eukprot:2638533-Rhodomonas_salina.1